MKQFKGKAIYNPSGRAGEYSYWACNFYTGCSNNCDYCYCKRGVMSSVWSKTPKLKKCFRDEDHALEIFEKDLKQNLPELQKHGLFFSFTTDPMLEETFDLNFDAIEMALTFDVPVKILTKKVHSMLEEFWLNTKKGDPDFKRLAFGFTLTGHDELEPGASTNAERIEAMRRLHEIGFKTFASIEPIIDFETSLNMILQTKSFCDLYKVGLMSGKKYDWRDIRGLMLACYSLKNNFYFKDSLLKQAGIVRANLPANCVGRDYNIFR